MMDYDAEDSVILGGRSSRTTGARSPLLQSSRYTQVLVGVVLILVAFAAGYVMGMFESDGGTLPKPLQDHYVPVPLFTIMQTNDVYHTHPIRFRGGLSRIAGIKQAIATGSMVSSIGNDRPVVAVHGGDLFSPSPLNGAVVNGSEIAGAHMVNITNMFFDVAVLGNHEFDLSEPQFSKRMAESAYPWLATNIHPFTTLDPAAVVKEAFSSLKLSTVDSKFSSSALNGTLMSYAPRGEWNENPKAAASPLAKCAAVAVAEVPVAGSTSRIRVGFVGVVGPYATPDYAGGYSAWASWPDTARLVRQYATALRDAGCSVVVLLSHLGLDDVIQLLEADEDNVANETVGVNGVGGVIGGGSGDQSMGNGSSDGGDAPAADAAAVQRQVLRDAASLTGAYSRTSSTARGWYAGASSSTSRARATHYFTSMSGGAGASNDGYHVVYSRRAAAQRRGGSRAGATAAAGTGAAPAASPRVRPLNIDIAMTGHEHTNGLVWRGGSGADLPIATADSDARSVFVHDMYLDSTTTVPPTVNGVYVKHDMRVVSRLVALDESIPSPPSVERLVDRWFDAAADAIAQQDGGLKVREPVAFLKHGQFFDARASTIRYQPTFLGQQIGDSLAAAAEADVGMTNSGSVRADMEYVGPFELLGLDLLDILPFQNLVKKSLVPGNVLRKALEVGLSNAGSGAFLISSTNVVCIPPPAGIGCASFNISGTAVDDSANYTVAMSDYVADGKESGLGFLSPLSGSGVVDMPLMSPRTVRDAFGAWLLVKFAVPPAPKKAS